MEGILIARLIFQLNITPALKTTISHCTFYGVQAGTVDILKRYKICKWRFLDKVLVAKKDKK